MDEKEFGELVIEALTQYEGDNPGRISKAASYADEGVMTMDEGVVVRTTDGQEFWLRIQAR